MSISTILKQKQLILDGAMGTMLPKVDGNSDEENVRKIHQLYVDAGADMITTSTFTDNALENIEEHSTRFVQIAREVADGADRKVYVLGSVGPASFSLTMQEDASFTALQNAYKRQIKAMAEAGVDALIFETFFDALNIKAALTAAAEVAPTLECLLSVTLEKSGRLLSGQTLEALIATVKPFNIISLGLNCSFGAKDMTPYLNVLAEKSPFYLSAYPNAGLPNALGGYDETPEDMAKDLSEIFPKLNIIGGCCGTTPEHIARLVQMRDANTENVRVPVQSEKSFVLSGLEPLATTDFIAVGERTNVAGSKKFARLIASAEYDEALQIARKQVEAGAQVIDVCMDDAMLDANACMAKFLYLMGTDPAIARVPVMIDSSHWDVLAEGLKHVQGKAIVNSISLKEGEEVFLKRAEYIKHYGAAVVVMAFDEQGQADSYERRVEICTRAYKLLTEKAGFPAEDIVFDPNILTIATGLKEHNNYAVDFIETVRYIKQNLPYAKCSGGVSNLSFAFRGNNPLREAMHAVFLHEARKAGLDMAIINPSTLINVSELDSTLKEKITNLVLNKSDDAAELLMDFVAQNGVAKTEKLTQTAQIEPKTAEERLVNALVTADISTLNADVTELLSKLTPLEIVENVLMKGMNVVGERFAAGNMFLPQVVKTAQTMKKAVEILTPYMSAGSAVSTSKPKVIVATVKGDVHDIGKNIVGVVLSCNGYEVIDLGVMVPKETIIEAVQRENPVALCLSGLISPSLAQMEEVAAELEKIGSKVPLIVGGATTSLKHTSIKIDPLYSGVVLHSNDASENVRLVNSLKKEPHLAALYKNKYVEIRENALKAQPVAHENREFVDWKNEEIKPFNPLNEVVENSPSLEELENYINWKAYFAAWQVKGEWAEKVKSDLLTLLTQLKEKENWTYKAVYKVVEAHSEGDNIILANNKCECCHGKIIPLKRESEKSACLSDFVSPEKDFIGVFATSVNVENILTTLREQGREYDAMLLQLFADRLAEALSVWQYEKVKQQWGVENMIRPAVGYSCLPNHSLKQDLLELLENKIDITLTETGAMIPVSSVCGLYISNSKAKYF